MKLVRSALVLGVCAAAPTLLGATFSAGADLLEVPAEWPTIQSGIDAAADGDTVLVSPGTYYENVRLRGKRILLTSYLADEWERRFPESAIVDGSYPLDPDSSAVFYFIDGEDCTTILRGFTITNGAGHLASGRRCGGGIFCERASPTIEGNLIVGNAAHCGGGLHYEQSGAQPLRLIGNEIRWNAAANFGGGVWIPGSIGPGGSAILMEGNLLQGNTASYGGAVAIQYGQEHAAELRGNVIIGNFGTYGGGIWCDKGHTLLLLERNEIAGNEGGALIVADYDPGSRIQLVNNTIASNSAGVDIWHALEIEIRNNIIVENDVGIRLENVGSHTISFNDVWANVNGDYVGCGPGFGDISDDPFFIGGVPPDRHLREESPCIDAGDPDSPPDPDGTRADMGAYFFDQGGPAAVDVGRGRADVLDLHVSPNVVAGATRIELRFAGRRGWLELDVCDASGRRIAPLYAGMCGPLRRVFSWDGANPVGERLPAGVYFLTARFAGEQACQRLICVH